MSRHLVLSGGPGHDFAATTAALIEVAGAVGLESTVVDDPAQLFAALCDAEAVGADAWDLVTVNALRWRMEQPQYAEQRDRFSCDLDAADAALLERHVTSGGGLVALHTAVICFDADPAWHRLLGASWRWDHSWHPPVGDALVEVTAAGRRHPITAGISSFTVPDEVYACLDRVADLEPLLTASHHGRAHPVLWARRVGPGRVVTDLLGHGEESLRDREHRTVLARALAWAAGTRSNEDRTDG